MNATVLWYSSRATGAVTLVLFTAVMVLGMATAGRASAPVLPRAAVLRLHRNLSLTAVAFLAVHIGTAIIDGYVNLGVWDVVLPFRAGFDPFWVGLGSVAVDLLLAIGITSALRRYLSSTTWRVIHLTSYAMWPLALAHGWGIAGGDGHQRWMVLLDVACIALVAGAALWWRLRPDQHPDRLARRSGHARHPREKAGAKP